MCWIFLVFFHAHHAETRKQAAREGEMCTFKKRQRRMKEHLYCIFLCEYLQNPQKMHLNMETCFFLVYQIVAFGPTKLKEVIAEEKIP